MTSHLLVRLVIAALRATLPAEPLATDEFPIVGAAVVGGHGVAHPVADGAQHHRGQLRHRDAAVLAGPVQDSGTSRRV